MSYIHTSLLCVLLNEHAITLEEQYPIEDAMKISVISHFHHGCLLLSNTIVYSRPCVFHQHPQNKVVVSIVNTPSGL